MNESIIPRCPKCGHETDKSGLCPSCGWKPLEMRVADIETEVVKARARIHHRREVCGHQKARDHDTSSRWQGKRLPSFNPA